MSKYDKYFQGKYALCILMCVTILITAGMSYIVYVGIKQQQAFERLYETTHRLQEGLDVLRAEEAARLKRESEAKKLEDKTAEEMKGL